MPPPRKKNGPAKGHGGRPRKPGGPRVKTSVYLAADTICLLRATGHVSEAIDELALKYLPRKDFNV